VTFAELVAAVQSRLNLTSTESATRIGITINDRYKRITSAIGINLSRRTTVQANVTVGVSTLNFAACEKIINVVDRSATPYRVLTECTVEQLGAEQPSSNATPRKYAILAVDAHSVTILLDCVPQSAFTLYADCYGRASTLSGSQEPAFEEDFHDILVHGALADEYRKMEKAAYARESEALYQERLSDLRMFRTKSSYLDIMQGGNSRRSVGVSGGSSGSGSSTNGATSYTQTGLITFDRTSAAAGSRFPFAVAAGSNKVANLDADLLDGEDGAAYHLAANLVLTDVTTNDVTSTKHGFAPKSPADATKFLNGAATPAYAQVKDSDLSLTDIVTNDVSTTKHGFTPKAPNLNTQVLIGTGAWGASGQLNFPAVQNASAGVNVLDDYEEGTWVPVIGGTGGVSGQTYSTQTGTYVKIGQFVMAIFDATLSNKGTITTSVNIQGLPFTAAAVPGGAVALQFGNLATNWISILAAVIGGTTTATLVAMSAAAASMSTMATADIGNTTRFTGTILYRASA
jgi:hypothetical protein